MNIVIRKENEDEQFAVEKLIREAFWNIYKPGCDEHLMVNQLHQSQDDPRYYNRFGFVNAKKYNISTPQNENFDEFMALEVSRGSLCNISGRCYESKAFEIDIDSLTEFERKFIVKKNHLEENTLGQNHQEE